jgi:Iron-containing redox enzyme
MRAALEVSRAAGEDPVCKLLKPYLETHIDEELYHDEWTLDDLGTIGVIRSDVLIHPPAANVASLVGAQYYWIYHCHPVALTGYMVMLESNAPSVQFVRQMIERTGLPVELFRTRMLHAELDPSHQEDLFDLIESLPLSHDQERLIARSVSHTSAMLADCLARPQLWNCRS